MQNRINRVKLQLDMPITADIDSNAGAQINGNTGSTTTSNVDGVNGTIAVDSTVVTGRGDVGTIASSNISSGSGRVISCTFYYYKNTMRTFPFVCNFYKIFKIFIISSFYCRIYIVFWHILRFCIINCYP